MESWGDLWSPAGVLGIAGVVELIVSRWPVGRRGLAVGCLLSLLVAVASWPHGSVDGSQRLVFTAVVAWGLLLAFGAMGESPDSKSVEQLPLVWIGFAGLCLLTLAGDLVTLFLGLQVVTHASGFGVGTRSVSAGERAAGDDDDGPERHSVATSTAVLAAVLLFGFVLLVLLTGSTRITTIAEVLRTTYTNRDAARPALAMGGSRVLTLSIVLIGSALCGYLAGAPFHARFVDAVSEGGADLLAPTRLLLPRAAALLVWTKLWPAALTGSDSTAQLMVIVLSAATLIMPLIQARAERHLVRQWGLLAVAQGGWLLLAIATTGFVRPVAERSAAWPVVEWTLPTAAQAVWLMLLVDGIALIGLFGVLSALRKRERPVEFVDDFQGLAHFEPVAAGCVSVCLLSLTAGPLLAGFWSRLFVALLAMSVRGEWGPPQMLVPHFGLMLLTILAVISSVWSASIAGRTLWAMYFGLPLGQPRPAGPISSLFVAAVASTLLVGCGVLPGPLLEWLCAPRG